MKKMLFLELLFLLIFVSACSGNATMDDGFSAFDYYQSEQSPGDEYQDIVENAFIATQDEPLSMFSVDANTAAYANLRANIENGREINPNQVRIEEMINYFDYDLPEPNEGDPLSISTRVIPCPWNGEHGLLLVGMKAEEVELSDMQNNLVFLLDVSGSMDSPNKIGLMKEAFGLLIDSLNDADTVSIVTYASRDTVLLDGGYGDEKTRIRNIINDLSAGGSTAGAQGIQTAYSLAETYFIEGGNNRVILATDGDFNVGISDPDDLEDFISDKRASGVYLSILGFGMGNYKDNRMEALANAGNGNYAYLDTILEAKKVLTEEIGGTLRTVARDVKAQIAFNPDVIDSYRLLGYENKLLTEEQYEDDETDAGEIGSGHSVVVVYEIALKESDEQANAFAVQVRYKRPDTEDTTVYALDHAHPSESLVEDPTEDGRFISSLVEFALILRDSEYKGDANLTAISERLESLELTDPYKAEFLELVKTYRDR